MYVWCSMFDSCFHFLQTAPQKRLPVVLRPTLRRLNIMTSNSIHRPHVEEAIPPEERKLLSWVTIDSCKKSVVI